ncbi:B3 domain-containing transcription factor abi3 [Thalictrum thalictroides]|uniref:B3 domain-containing transcription factor abi3 n=2 Tax=Thalictrum thalictroides TaxID=46969 RepID=A0A7J6VZR7_THATH|nr:B3 domain-containing transcription factor abi3 [Thalictrum thalictroides]
MLRFLLQKELRQSDVGNLGRVVLPKRASEAFLPNLASKEGILISMDDIDGLRIWNFKYRFRFISLFTMFFEMHSGIGLQSTT